MTREHCLVTMTASDHAILMAHLFPGDGEEHGGVLQAGLVETPDGLRLCIHTVVLARDNHDYVPGRFGHRALDPRFIHQQITTCRDHGWAYLAFHNHDCDDRVGFSRIDMESHERGYPALLDIGEGVPVGALVFGRRSADVDLWLADGRRLALGELRVIGERLERLWPEPPTVPGGEESFERQIRMFGAAGQDRLRKARVGVIGLGGIGSLVAEQLARLGVGEMVLIDPDHIETSNLSRVVGAARADLTRPSLKVAIAERHLREAREDIALEVIADDVATRSVAVRLRSCDFLVLAADSMRARLVFNALVHQYLIPGVQLGAKIRPSKDGRLDDAMCAVRWVLPGEGCLWCNQLIDPNLLALEAKTEAERRAQAYGVAEPNPSVISLNAVAAAHAVNDFLFYFLDLGTRERGTLYTHFHFAEPALHRVTPRRDSDCSECGRAGRLGRGDGLDLPCLAG